ncbi:hypothetical protein [Streptomyces asiaticus]|uniref:hypothetical protein n=1 Tax=Streptomyces asiaticus TaxID=114695 RepID=UPI003D71E1EE
MTWVWLLASQSVLVMYGRFGSAALPSLLRDPAHHVAKSGHLLPSQSFRLRALNRVDTELETHISTATGATHTVTRAAPAHRIMIIGHTHQPARVRTRTRQQQESQPKE